MILSMADQARFFIWTMVLGAAAGIIYDVFRIVRRMIKHHDIFTQIEDLIYWLVVSVLIFYFILHRNNGEVRIYAIVGVFSGMCLYFISLSQAFVTASVAVINILKKIIAKTIGILLIPVKFLLKLLSYPVRIVRNWLFRQLSSGKSIAKKTNRFAGMKVTDLKNDLYIIRKKI